MRNDTKPQAVLLTYANWFYLPAALVFGVFFLVPTVLSFYFSLTRWSLFDAKFIGFDNFALFLSDPQLLSGLRNTIIYAVMTSGLKVIIALPLAMLLTSRIQLKGLFRGMIFFPVLVSTVAVGITFSTLMQPSIGLINTALGSIGLPTPDWLGNPRLALFSVALVDVWKGIGLAMVIFIAGILSIPVEYFEAAKLEGGAWVAFRHVILPLSRNASFTVILLSFIGGVARFSPTSSTTHRGRRIPSIFATSGAFNEILSGVSR